jgi:hypothetical protein
MLGLSSMDRWHTNTVTWPQILLCLEMTDLDLSKEAVAASGR